jgi:hypothetical protein
MALISSTKEKLQTKFNDVKRYTHSTGFKINTAKTKVMRLNVNNNQSITNNDQKEIEDESNQHRRNQQGQ